MTTEQTQEIIDLVQSGLTSLGEKLGVAVPHVWEVLIRQQYVYAIQYTLGAVAGLVAVVVGAFLVRWGFKDDGYNDGIPQFMIGGAMILIGGMFLFTLTGEAVARFINPEYYAIQDISTFIRGVQ